MKRLTSFFASVIVICCLSGCLLVPFIDAFKKTGLTPSDREALLGPEVKKFTDTLVWGDKQAALTFVTSESRKAMSKALKELGGGLHYIDAKVNDVVYSESSFSAKVDMTIRYYEAPYYVVKNQNEEQSWVFGVTSGWKLESRTPIDDS